MKKFALIFKIFGGLCLLAIFGVALFLYTLDLNKYKPQISQLVEETSGRSLDIKGEINWSLYPYIGIDIGRTEFGNAAGFSDALFASFDNIEVGLSLTSLLKKQIRAKKLRLKGATINLEVNRQGKNNWSDLSAKSATKTKSEEQKPAKKTAVDLQIAGVEIENAKVKYSDNSKAANRVVLEDFNFKSKEIILWQPIAFSGNFKVKNAQPAIVSSFNYQGTLIADVPKHEFGVENLKFALNAAGKTLPNNEIKLNATTSLLLNTNTQIANLKKLNLTIDDSNIVGTAKMRNFKKPAVDFTLKIDQLNLDHYLPKKAATSSASSKKAQDAKITLPLKALRKLNLSGNASIGKLQIMNLKSEKVEVGIEAHKGIINLSPLALDLYNGKFDGGLLLNAQQQQPAYQLQAKLDSLQVLPFLKDFLDKDMVEGIGGFDINIKTQGELISALKQNLNGNIAAQFDQGVLHLDMLNSFKNVLEKLGQQKYAAQIADGKNKTPFNMLKVASKVENGVFSTDSLDVDANGTRIEGLGSFNINNNELDSKLQFSSKDFSCQVPIAGKLATIDYKKAMLMAVPNCAGDVLEQKAQQELDKAKQKLQQKAEQEQEKLDQKMRQQEQKAAEKIQKEQQKLDDKIEKETKKQEQKLQKYLEDKFKF